MSYEETLTRALGPAVQWAPKAFPDAHKGAAFMSDATLTGTLRIESLSAKTHGRLLYHVLRAHDQVSPGSYESIFLYLFWDPPCDEAAFLTLLRKLEGQKDPMFFTALVPCQIEDDSPIRSLGPLTPYEPKPAAGGALVERFPVVDGLNKEKLFWVPVGFFALMRDFPVHGTIEIGSVCYSKALQRTYASTEILYVVMKYVFEGLGYRRFEWKCNARNEPSRTAALRYGFRYESIFRENIFVKNRRRDTAWYAMLDWEYHGLLRAAYTNWFAHLKVPPSLKVVPTVGMTLSIAQEKSLADFIVSQEGSFKKEGSPRSHL